MEDEEEKNFEIKLLGFEALKISSFCILDNKDIIIITSLESFFLENELKVFSKNAKELKLTIDKFQTNDLEQPYKGEVYRLKENKIIYGLNSTEIKIINLLKENTSFENLYTIKLKGEFYPVELDDYNLIIGNEKNGIYFYKLNNNHYEKTTKIEFDKYIIKMHYNKKYNELIILYLFGIDFLNMKTLSFKDEWRKKYIYYFLPLDDDNIILSDNDVWWMDFKSHNLGKNIGEILDIPYDVEARINFVKLLNDRSLFILKEFYNNYDNTKTKLHIWKLNENKEYELAKEEEFEGEKDLMIDNIYIYENDTFIYNSFKNGLYSIKILNN